MRLMAKKKEKTETIYADIPARLKRQLAQLADEAGRKLNAELARAIAYYVAAEMPNRGVRPPAPEDE